MSNQERNETNLFRGVVDMRNIVGLQTIELDAVVFEAVYYTYVSLSSIQNSSTNVVRYAPTPYYHEHA